MPNGLLRSTSVSSWRRQRKKPEKANKRKYGDDEHHDDGPGGSGNGADANLAERKEEASGIPEAGPNQGTLILDATCTPADMRFPTDLGLLNEAREKLDGIIDTLHEASGKAAKRPRTYRDKARKDYLTVSKQRSPRKNQLRQAVKKQLQYCRRNLGIVNRMLQQATAGTVLLSRRQETLLATIRELINQ